MNLREMFGLRVPIISVVIGEGGSGGALAIGACRRCVGAAAGAAAVGTRLCCPVACCSIRVACWRRRRRAGGGGGVLAAAPSRRWLASRKPAAPPRLAAGRADRHPLTGRTPCRSRAAQPAPLCSRAPYLAPRPAGCANRNLIMENSVYYVASPEACAAILWKSRDKAGTVRAARRGAAPACPLCRAGRARAGSPRAAGGPGCRARAGSGACRDPPTAVRLLAVALLSLAPGAGHRGAAQHARGPAALAHMHTLAHAPPPKRRPPRRCASRPRTCCALA